MTTEEIREKLGLLPWDEFDRRREEQVKNSPLPESEWAWRRTGATTKMLLKALSALSDGKIVHISAYSSRYARDLVIQCREWAAKLGLNPFKIHVFKHHLTGVEVFNDHHWGR